MHRSLRVPLICLLGLLLGLPLSNIDGPIGTIAPIGISVFLGLGMVGLTVAKRHDLITAAESMGLIRRPAGDGEGSGIPRILVDTSAIIDGRIKDIVESGFVYGTLVVPKFVLEELQHIADRRLPAGKQRDACKRTVFAGWWSVVVATGAAPEDVFPPR